MAIRLESSPSRVASHEGSRFGCRIETITSFVQLACSSFGRQRVRKIAVPLAVVSMLAIHAGLLAYSATTHSPTINEPGHLVAGLSYWEFGRFEVYRVNPPLTRLIAALPVIAAGHEANWSAFYGGLGARPEFPMGADFIAANGERSIWLFTIARWACIPISLIGGGFCFLWAQERSLLFLDVGNRQNPLMSSAYCYPRWARSQIRRGGTPRQHSSWRKPIVICRKPPPTRVEFREGRRFQCRGEWLILQKVDFAQVLREGDCLTSRDASVLSRANRLIIAHLLVAICVSFNSSSGEAASHANHFKVDFRTDDWETTDDWQAHFRLYGNRVIRCIDPSKQGLKLKLPVGSVNRRSVGISLRRPLNGDFDATVEFAKLQSTDTFSSQGDTQTRRSGLEIYMRAETGQHVSFTFTPALNGELTASASIGSFSHCVEDSSEFLRKQLPRSISAIRLHRAGELFTCEVVINQAQVLLFKRRVTANALTFFNIGLAQEAGAPECSIVLKQIRFNEATSATHMPYRTKFRLGVFAFAAMLLAILIWRMRQLHRPHVIHGRKLLHYERWHLVALLLLTLCGIGLRLIALEQRSLWYDEVLSWRLQSFDWATLLIRSSESTARHPPLYFVILKVWCGIVGDSAFAMRLFSAVAGGLAIPALFALVLNCSLLDKERYFSQSTNANAALLAAFLLCMSPLHIHLSQQARGYTFAIILVLLSSIFLIQALVFRSWTSGTLYASACLALLYVHNLGSLVVCAQGLFSALFIILPKNTSCFVAQTKFPSYERRRTHFHINELHLSQLGRAFLLFGTIVVLYIPWLTHVLTQGENLLRHSWIRPIVLYDVSREVYDAWARTSSDPAPNSCVLPVAALFILLGLWALMIGRCGIQGVFIVVIGAVPTVLILLFSLFSARSIFEARYLSIIQSFWLIAVAFAVLLFPWRRERILSLAVLMLLVLRAYVFAWNLIGSDYPPGMRGAFQHIDKQYVSGDIVVCESSFVFFGAKYYGEGKPVFILTDTKDRFSLVGDSLLQKSDLLTVDDLVSKSPQRVWYISTEVYRSPWKSGFAPFPFKTGWDKIEEHSFSQAMAWEKEIAVELFLREQ